MSVVVSFSRKYIFALMSLVVSFITLFLYKSLIPLGLLIATLIYVFEVEDIIEQDVIKYSKGVIADLVSLILGVGGILFLVMLAY